MNMDLTDTTSSKINAALVRARRTSGTPAVGMVLTLVIVTDEGNHYDAMKAAHEVSREHPSRILAVIRRPGKTPRARSLARLDAELRVGGDYGTGETIVLRLYGKLADHAQSVVLPLLLPDAPVVVWWPEEAPKNPSRDPLGQLAQRRVTDAAGAEDPVGELTVRAEQYEPGDTDLTWTRVTQWRSLLAAALDQKALTPTSAHVSGEALNPSADLLAMWLGDRLDVPVTRQDSEGPGLTSVRLESPQGAVTVERGDGAMATLSIPGSPNRQVALQRRDTAALIAEELRRLDPDETYRCTLLHGVRRKKAAEALAKPEDVSGETQPSKASGTSEASDSATYPTQPATPTVAPPPSDEASDSEAAAGEKKQASRTQSQPKNQAKSKQQGKQQKQEKSS